MRREERVVELAYNEQDPVNVADDVAANAEAVAEYVETFGPSDWQRTMTYNYPGTRGTSTELGGASHGPRG